MQYICRPCAAHILCLQTMCSICIGICGLCTQHIFKHGAKHICRPCAEPICNLCASHSCFIWFCAEHICKLCAEHICRPWAAYWYIGRPVQHILSSRNWRCIAMGWLCCFGPWFCALPSLCLQALWYHTCRILGVGRLTDTGGLHGYLTSLWGVHHICIWEDLTSIGVPGYLD